MFKALIKKILEKIYCRYHEFWLERVARRIRPHFHSVFYLNKYKDVGEACIDPVRHYIENGAQEGRDPAPTFSTKNYLDHHRDQMAKDRVSNPFDHFVRQQAKLPDTERFKPIIKEQPGIDESIAYVNDLNVRLTKGKLLEQIVCAADLEPLVHFPDSSMIYPKTPPVIFFESQKTMQVMKCLHQMAEYRRAKAAVIIPHCRVSGATRIAAHLGHALTDLFGADDVVFIRTDRSDMAFENWFPAGVRQIDLALTCRQLSDTDSQAILLHFLRSLDLNVVFNVNSRLFWDSLLPYGEVMSDAFAMYSYLFCYDITAKGYETGYPAKFFYQTYDVLDGIICDSAYLENRLRERFILQPNDHRLATIPTSLLYPPGIVEPISKPSNARPKIFWAGRFDPQKRVDILYAVARQIPQADFEVWGKAVIADADLNLGKLPDNVTLHGVYQTFDDLPLRECDAWLYTSAWDGVPTILLDVAAAGIPLVGSDVGGTGEILKLGEGLAYSISDFENVDLYVSALNKILENPAKARFNAAKLSQLVKEQRNEKNYCNRIRALLEGRGLL